MIKSSITYHLFRICIVGIIILLTSISLYSQDTQTKKEIDQAIENVMNGNYEQAIPVLKKNADVKTYDELTKLQINVYLNLCFMALKDNALNVEVVNNLTDSYLGKNDISKSDNSKREDELSSLMITSVINGGIGNNKNMVSYLSIIKRVYENENLNTDDGMYSEVLRLLTRGYFNLNEYSSAIEAGQIALKSNFNLFGEKNNSYLEILDLLYLASNRINEKEKSFEYLQKEVEIGREVWGEKNPEYLIRLGDLAAAYSNRGNFQKALEINQIIVQTQLKELGENHPDYIKSLNRLALAYSNNGDDQKSLEICLKAVDISSKFLGEKDKIYLNCLNNLSSIYLNIGSYKKALETNLKVLELSRIVLGEKHPDYIKRLGSLALVYSKTGDYKKALQLNLTVAELLKETLGEKSPDYLTCLSNLAVVYSKLGDYKKALKIDIEVAEVRKEIFGEKDPDYLTSLANIATVYSLLGNYTMALEVAQKETELIKEVLGEKHPAYITSLSNLSNIYASAGDYKKALEISIEASVIGKENFGITHPTYLNSLINLAGRYSQIGDYYKALGIYTDAEKLFLQIFGDKNPNYFNLLVGLSSLYLKLGDYEKALTIKREVTASRKEVLGDLHPDYITSLASQVSVYLLQGEYLPALEIGSQALRLYKQVLGEIHPDYLTCLTNLALTYYYLGDYQNALKIDNEVFELQKKVLGEKHPFCLVTMSNLSLVYSQIGKNQQALEMCQKSIEIGKEVLGERHPEYLKSLATLASIYYNLGEYKNAVETNLKVVNIRKEILGEKHPDYLGSLGNLASGYSRLGDYSKAFKINREVTNSFKEVLGESNPNYKTGLINLAVSEYNISLTDSALYHYNQMVKLTLKKVVQYFSLMTEFQRENYWKQSSNYLGRFPMFLVSTKNTHPEAVCDAYNIALFTKGLLLNTTIDFEKLITEKGTSDAIAKFDELELLRLQIQRLQEKPIAERYLNIDSLENIAQQKETELVKLSKEYGDYTRNLKITWKDVQSKLNKNEVAIEFVEYPTLSDTVKYAALVLEKDWEYPKMIYLFQKDELNNLVNQSADRIYSNSYVGQQIKKLIWEPLEDFVSRGDKVYFSPSGLLHQIAIENLPANDSMTLEEYYPMYRLSSTKELVINKPKEDNKSSALYGGLYYDIDDSIMLAQSRMFDQTNTSAYAMRGYNQDSTLRQGWNYLEGTLTEVDQIGDMMTSGGYRVVKYTGIDGNEESFKALSGRNTGIIHIATHGFFLPIEDTRRNEFMQARLGDQARGSILSDPMQRSGLMLAGGNKAWQGEEIPTDIEDGVMTAKEISHLDLRGTDLVVLSACETGLGEVSSEGVFGLQRSFKQAGAQSLVMTLWEVNDQATDYFMTEFYKSYLAGKGKRESFLEAKKSCREKFPEPQYWGGFVLLD